MHFTKVCCNNITAEYARSKYAAPAILSPIRLLWSNDIRARRYYWQPLENGDGDDYGENIVDKDMHILFHEIQPRENLDKAHITGHQGPKP